MPTIGIPRALAVGGCQGWQEGRFSYTIHTPRFNTGNGERKARQKGRNAAQLKARQSSWLVRLDFRASTEWPGNDSPRDWTGKIVLIVNGRRVARLNNGRDDGQGSPQRLWLQLPADQDVTIDFLIPGLSDEQDRGGSARGLCLYDKIELQTGGLVSRVRRGSKTVKSN